MFSNDELAYSKNGKVNAPINTAEIKGAEFTEFTEISEKSIENFKAREINSLFPVQAGTFKEIYDGSDVIARDLTGSGKTIAFTLPLVEKFRKLGIFEESSRLPRRKLLAIMLAPTRELAL